MCIHIYIYIYTCINVYIIIADRHESLQTIADYYVNVEINKQQRACNICNI